MEMSEESEMDLPQFLLRSLIYVGQPFVPPALAFSPEVSCGLRNAFTIDIGKSNVKMKMM